MPNTLPLRFLLYKSKMMRYKGRMNLPPWLPLPEWHAYVAMRVRTKHPLTERAMLMELRKLSRLRDEGHDPALVLMQSHDRGWRGLFPVSTNGSPSQARKIANQIWWAKFLGVSEMRRV